MRSGLLYLLGVPIPLIILLAVFTVIAEKVGQAFSPAPFLLEAYAERYRG